MSYLLENELWDKPNAIIAFNDNNTLIMEKFQKFIADFSKSQTLNILNQKRTFEKFLSEIEDQKTSEFSYSTCTYFLTEKLLEILAIQETFNDVLLQEVDEIIKEKTLTIKKDTKNWKIQKKKMFEDLSKENQKHDSEFKRYCSRNNLKDVAYAAYLKAEENKSLSRNQVDNFHKAYLTRKAEYDQSKQDYCAVLDSFNQYQSNHYYSVLPEWGLRGEEIEKHRYEVLKSTFTNLSELCRSLASKSKEIADQIELHSELIDCSQDCLCLINKEKTGDIPPGDISFKDFDSEQNHELNTPDKRTAKISSSSSDSTSVTNMRPKMSISDIKKRGDSMSNSTLSVSTTNSTGNNVNTSNSNGMATSGSKIFTKLFGGIKKTKDPSSKSALSEIEALEALLEEKLSSYSTYELNDEFDKEIDDIRNKLESLKTEAVKSNSDYSPRKSSLFQSLRHNPRNKSIDYTPESTKDKSFLGKVMVRNSRQNSEKRRSRSVSSIHRSYQDVNINYNDNEPEMPPRFPDSNGPTTKPKSKSIFNSTVKYRSNKERKEKETSSVYSKSIEVLRNMGPVEIVSTPAEAMASVSRISSIYVSEYEFSDDKCNETGVSANSISKQSEDVQMYRYYYIGSCVAIHEYTTSDPSDIYLSFNTGEQFYIVQEDTECSSTGWLLVERIDRSKFGYVPESYMDRRNFDNPVLMHSNHPIMLA